MTFKDEVDAAGERYWKNAYEDRVTDILDTCVEKIDELERDLDNVRAATVHTDERMDKLELKLFNLSVIANQPAVEIPKIPEEVLRDAIEIFKATVAEKKQELSEVMKRHGLDLSAAHDFTGPGEHPEE